MRKRNNELAIRQKPSTAVPPEVIYRTVPHEAQYVIHQTLLGDSALCWSATWLAGFFCVVDFPAELCAYVQNVLIGPQQVGTWDGGDELPFEESLGDVARGGGPFAAVAEALLRGHEVLQLALPGRGESIC